MRYVRPTFYDKFRCIAQKCPATCCRGWQIVIDPDSLKKYRLYGGEFGERLRRSVSWEEGTFLQYGGTCAMLNEEGLCDLYIQAGEAALCQTCARYPRHMEEFENVREYSLSVSCPEAARILLEETEPFSFIVEDTPEEESFEEGFDFLLYTNLADAREVLFSVLQNRNLPFWERMLACLRLAGVIQNCLEQGDISGMEEAIARGTVQKEDPDDRWVPQDPRYQRILEEWEVLYRLERLDPEWETLLEREKAFLLSCGKETYDRICLRFDQLCTEEYPGRQLWEHWMEKTAMSFVYTHFCGAVYDDAIHCKVWFAYFSVQWIRELLMMEWYVDGQRPDQESWITMTYRYARELEHLDQNLISLDDYFWEKTHPDEKNS